MAVAVVVAFLTSACFANGSPPPTSSSPHHDDPFLTCVRQHETGGSYTVDSPDGLLHGAYQFLQSTWDGTAIHVGRSDLVGVDPHTKDPTTQDDMAWALYQWLGTAPWADSGC
jgi:Transglycosylase-like domain